MQEILKQETNQLSQKWSLKHVLSCAAVISVPTRKGAHSTSTGAILLYETLSVDARSFSLGWGDGWPRKRGCCFWEKGTIIAGQERVNLLANSLLFPSLAKSTFGFSLSDNLSTRTSTIKKLYRIWDTYKLSQKITWYTFRKREHTSEQDTWQYDQRSRQL